METRKANPYIHFMHQHMTIMIVILNEGTTQHPRFRHCYMFAHSPKVYITRTCKILLCKVGEVIKGQRGDLEVTSKAYG